MISIKNYKFNYEDVTRVKFEKKKCDNGNYKLQMDFKTGKRLDILFDQKEDVYMILEGFWKSL